MMIRAVMVSALVLACMACNKQPEPGGSESGSSVPTGMITQQKAIELGREHLRSQPFAADYLLETAEASDGSGEWHVWIKRKDWETVKPSRGHLTVDKTSGTVRWQPEK